MTNEQKLVVSAYLNNMLELSLIEKLQGVLHYEEWCKRRVYIINNPKKGIYDAIRRRAELIVGLEDPTDKFPQWVQRLVHTYLANKLLEGVDPHEVVEGYNDAEMEEGSLFPQLLAAFAADWLTTEDRWKTRKFRKIIKRVSNSN